MTYTDPILKKYRDLILTNNKEFKEVYFGDPIMVPQASLPALVLTKVSTLVSDLTNAEDEHRITIKATVITSVMKEFKDDHTTRHGLEKLYAIIEGRGDDYRLTSDSILGILRSNEQVDIANNLRTDLGSVTRADYGMTMDKRDQGAWSLEGEITFEAHFTQLR